MTEVKKNLDTARSPRFQINSVSARNFRSISQATANLNRLTVLVGRNASGKSNILDILRFIRDAFRFDLDAAISMRHGLSAIHHEPHPEAADEIELGLSATINRYSLKIPVDVEYRIGISTSPGEGHEVRHEYIKIWGTDSGSPSAEFRIVNGNLTQPSTLLTGIRQQRLFDDEELTDFDSRDLALPTLMRLMRGPVVHQSTSSTDFRVIYTVLSDFYRRMMDLRLYHMFPNTIREPQKLTNTMLLDENAANLASVLRAMERRDRDPSPRMSRLKEYLARLIPGVSDLEVSAAGGYMVVRLKHDSLPGHPWIDLSLESDGTVRLLGLLTALNQSRKPSLIGMEEPELTVHPGALSTLADVLYEAALTTQLLITTHSPDFIDCITQFRSVESVRIVELVDGVTKIEPVAEAQAEAVRQHLFSPGELHRMGDLEIN